MSKLAKIPVKIPEGVNVSFENDLVKVKGSKGELSFGIPKGIDVKIVEGRAVVALEDRKREDLKPSLGLTRASIANMVTGVHTGFEKKLELSGVGYRAVLSGPDITLSLGFSHPVKVAAMPGINFSISENVISISGINKQLVGDMASRIRAIRPPEPYKGKGIKYYKEKIRRKAGKAAKALGATK